MPNGFVTKSSAPASSAATLSCCPSRTETTMIGTSLNARIRWITSAPSTSGRPRSSRIRSGDISAAPSTPSSPVPTAVTSYPCASRLVRSARRICGSSSTTSTFTLTPSSPAARTRRRYPRRAPLRSRCDRRARPRPPARWRARGRSPAVPARRRRGRTPRTRARVRPPGCRRPGPRPDLDRVAERGGGNLHLATGGECAAAFSSRFVRTWSICTGSTNTSGRSGRTFNRTTTPIRLGRIRATVASTISSIAAASRAGTRAPALILDRSIRLPTSRFIRSVSSRTVVRSSRRCAGS